MRNLAVRLAGWFNAISLAKSVTAEEEKNDVDVLLIGGGIMSATLGTYLQELEPTWRLGMVERLDSIAEESSNGWNNAGTGHSALAEMNYTRKKATARLRSKRPWKSMNPSRFPASFGRIRCKKATCKTRAALSTACRT